MPQLDISMYMPQVVWLVITFVTLYIIMWKAVVPAISNTLEARQRRIGDNLDKAAELKKEAQAALEAYEQAMSRARTEASQVLAEAGAELSAKVAKEEAKLADKLTAQIAESEARIATAVKNAMSDIGAVAAEAAGQVIRKLIGEDADDKAVADAVDAAMKATAVKAEG